MLAWCLDVANLAGLLTYLEVVHRGKYRKLEALCLNDLES